MATAGVRDRKVTMFRACLASRQPPGVVRARCDGASDLCLSASSSSCDAVSWPQRAARPRAARSRTTPGQMRERRPSHNARRRRRPSRSVERAGTPGSWRLAHRPAETPVSSPRPAAVNRLQLSRRPRDRTDSSRRDRRCSALRGRVRCPPPGPSRRRTPAPAHPATTPDPPPNCTVRSQGRTIA